jgi:hypothetical protein
LRCFFFLHKVFRLFLIFLQHFDLNHWFTILLALQKRKKCCKILQYFENQLVAVAKNVAKMLFFFLKE